MRPRTVPLADAVAWLDALLRTADFVDSSRNGLQVENGGGVSRIATAVDCRMESIEAARRAGADLLVVHHGLFWREPERVVGPHHRRLKALLDGGIAVYAAHLPLDAHPEVGNNARLAAALGLGETRSCFEDRPGQRIGIVGALPTPVTAAELAARLASCVQPYGGAVRGFGNGPEAVRTVGIVSGDAADWVDQAAKVGVDAYVTGETDHAAACVAGELGLHLVCGGHYATETFGVRALGERMSRELGVPWEFVHAPTGL